VTRTLTRRAAVAVLGTGLAALTGATARQSGCSAVTGADTACADDVALSGPDAVAAAGSGPRFVATNEGRERVELTTGNWAVFRRERGDWTRIGAGAGGGTVALGPGEETAWILLSGDAGAASSLSVRTRYVGPVDLAAGDHAFVVTGDRDGERFEAAARFAVRE
jgi:hypothetical protein